MDSENIVVWNVRGLNGRARRDVVASSVQQERSSLLCVQETKSAVIDDDLIHSMLGTGFLYDYIPAVGTCGSIMVAWRTSIWSVL
jgi:exonuclease III